MTKILALPKTTRTPISIALAACLGLTCGAAWAKEPVTGIDTLIVAGTPVDIVAESTVMLPSPVGEVTLHYSGTLRPLTKVATASGTFGMVRGVGDVKVHRNSTSNNAITLRFERTDGTPNEINLNAPAVNTLEEALLMNSVNLGSDNLFNNDISTVQSSNVERVDFLFAPVVNVTTIQLTNMVIPVFDRAALLVASDPFQIAVLRGDDNGSCAAPVAGDLVLSDTAGVSLDHPDTIVSRRDPDTEPKMRPGGRSEQGIKGQVFTLADLGVNAGETVCGFALFGADATGTDPLDPTQNPIDTTEKHPNNNGGLDLVAATGLFELNAVTPLSPPVATDDTKVEPTPGSTVSLDVLGNDTDPESNINPGSVILIVPPGAPAGSAVSNGGKTLTMPGEGVWTADPVKGQVTFTPETGLLGSPTPIQYTVSDSTDQISEPAKITVAYPPVAVEDTKTGQAPGSTVALDVVGNDPDPAKNLDPKSVTLIVPPGAPVGSTVSNGGKTLTVPGEGVWTVDPVSGDVTFTPDGGLVGDPTPILYTIKNLSGLVSPHTKITVTYLPVATDDTKTGQTPGSSVTLDVVGNDPNKDKLDPKSVTLIVPPGAPVGSTVSNGGKTLTVPGEGVWTVDPVSGDVTFTPDGGLVGDPTPILYTIKNLSGLVSPHTKITVTYLPVATDDTKTGQTPGSSVTLDVVGNDPNKDKLDPKSVTLIVPPGAPAGSTVSNGGKTLTVPGEGVWTVDPVSGEVTFTPDGGLVGDPTPILYTVRDSKGQVSPHTKITVTYPPVATDDTKTGQTPGSSVTLDVVGNDPNKDKLDPKSVTLIVPPGAPVGSTVSNGGKTLTVPGEGVWTVDPVSGEVTFTPDGGLVGDPTPILYTVRDSKGQVSPHTKITVTYPPVATDDTKTGQTPGSSVTLDVVGNDPNKDKLDPKSVTLIVPPGAPVGSTVSNGGKTLTVPGEGVWTVDPVSGEVTFTPDGGLVGDPTPILYTIKNLSGLESEPALITVTYGGNVVAIPVGPWAPLVVLIAGATAYARRRQLKPSARR